MEERKGYFIVAVTRASYVIRGALAYARVVPLAPQPKEIRVVECGGQGCIEGVVRLREAQPDSHLP